MEHRIIKLIIISYLSCYGPKPEDGSVMLQRLTVREDGRIWYSDRVWSDAREFDYAPGKRMQLRIPAEDARSILNSASALVGSADADPFRFGELLRDVGVWSAECTLVDGTCTQVVYSSGSKAGLEDLEAQLRRLILIQDLALFG